MRIDVLAWDRRGIEEVISNVVQKHITFQRILGNNPAFPMGCGTSIEGHYTCVAAYMFTSLNALSCSISPGGLSPITGYAFGGGYIRKAGGGVPNEDLAVKAPDVPSVTIGCSGTQGSASYTYHVDIP